MFMIIKLATGKLERITERLAKQRQHSNGLTSASISTISNGDSSIKRSSSPTDESLLSNKSELANEIDGSNDDVDDNLMKSSSIDDDDMDEDIGDEEDEDDDMENGLQALGLMGNVAYMTTGDDAFKCPVCGLQLDSQHTFTLHIRSHNPNDHSNTCSLCGKTLSSASSLDRHMLIHSGERPFKCSLCGMAFTTNGNMHRHMRTHGHGSIGYTPRGQKRRAKLLTQALEKAVAQATAGEQVDYEAINKLKKSILESKVTIPTTTTGGKRQSKNQQQQSAATTFSEQLLSSLAPNVSIEAAAAAAVAAAHNAAGSKDGDSILSHLSAVAAATANSQHQSGSGRKHRNRNSHLTTTTSQTVSTTPLSSISKSNDKTKESPISTTNNSSVSNMPLNLANNNNNSTMVSWSKNQHSAMNPSTTTTTPTNIPEKGRPGRKKKQRLSDPGSIVLNGMMNHSHPLSSSSSTQVQIPQSLPTHPQPPPPLPTTIAPFQQSPPSSNNHHHSISSFGSIKDRCPICAHPIRTMPELHLHMMAYHMHERLFCNDCGMILDNYDTYTHHHCTASATTVMQALNQNPNLQSDLLFCSSNTSRMNFSSARTYAANLELLRAGLTAATNGVSGGNSNQHLQAAAAAQVMLQAAQLAQQQQQNSLPQQPPPPPQSSTSRKSNSQQHAKVNCSQCSRKFFTSKELKQHHDTYCHQCQLECDSISTYQFHQFSHSFEKLSQSQSQLNVDNKMQLLKNVAFPFQLSSPTSSALVTNPSASSLISSSASALIHNHDHHHHSTTPPPPQLSKQTSIPTISKHHSTPSSSSIASLTSMANMKPDLADIESILSIVHATNSMKNSNQHSSSSSSTAPAANNSNDNDNSNKLSINNGQQLRSPISPNRANDAGDYHGATQMKRHQQMNGGEATNQPDSPASADSAAGAIAASNLPGQNCQTTTTMNMAVDNHHHHHRHSTKTDLNQTNGKSSPSATAATAMALCLTKSSSNNNSATINNIAHHNDKSILSSSPPKSKQSSIKTESQQKSSKINDGSKISTTNQTKPQRFRCESCRLSFKSLNALRRHNRGHTAEGGHSHACHLCPYKSLDKSTLIRHLRTHNGERPFQCAICKYAFTTKANCERHIRKRHRNLKSKSEIRNAMQYNIDMASTAAATRLVSEKIFIERDQLPTSQDTVCKKCDEDFGTNRELRQHLRQPNNPCSQQLKPFVCTICSIGFNTRNNCVRHIIKQHPTIVEIGNNNNNDDDAKIIDAESLMIETGSSSSLSPSSQPKRQSTKLSSKRNDKNHRHRHRSSFSSTLSSGAESSE
ncbi:Metal ion binding [Dermatophagoides pteronyssinus]|uniref:Metal ion binding n=1 Tax=Dermatophagoides pteronyssinus TaxID=6956 RepID=A0ABQ8JV24_DERPT|nr:Metal ion binding [Dermatophagoides pteronyssinus]